jgi:hypothetical protein
VDNLFNAPGMSLEVAGAGILALGVACYLARVAWIALSFARQFEQEAARHDVSSPNEGFTYAGPYCAG